MKSSRPRRAGLCKRLLRPFGGMGIAAFDCAPEARGRVRGALMLDNKLDIVHTGRNLHRSAENRRIVASMILPPSDDQTLAGFLELIAATYSSRPALVYSLSLRTEVCTERDLLERADRVAGFLQGQGAGKGDRIALWAPNGPWCVA